MKVDSIEVRRVPKRVALFGKLNGKYVFLQEGLRSHVLVNNLKPMRKSVGDLSPNQEANE